MPAMMVGRCYKCGKECYAGRHADITLYWGPDVDGPAPIYRVWCVPDCTYRWSTKYEMWKIARAARKRLRQRG